MKLWVFISIAIVILIWWLFFRKVKPLYYRNIIRDGIKEFIRNLLEFGGHNTLLIIQHQSSERFIQFAKYIESESRRNLHFGFPDAPWSRDYFEPLKQKLKAEGVEFEVQSVADSSSFVRQFLNINYIENVEAAMKIVDITLNIMGLDEKEKFTVHYDGFFDHKEVKRYERK